MPNRKTYSKRRLEEPEKPRELPTWVTSMSDMMSLLFALFALLYGMSKVNEGKFRQVAEALSRSLSTGGMTTTVRHKPKSIDNIVETPINLPTPTPTPTDSPNLIPKTDDLSVIQENIEQALRKQGLKGKVVMNLEERGLIVSMLTDDLVFKIGEAELMPLARKIIDTIAPTIQMSTNPIRIEGHTCNIPIATSRFRSNWELSTMRATNVGYYLIANKKINPERVSILGYGEFRPMYSNTGAERAKNRRVDIVILKSGGDPAAPADPKNNIFNMIRQTN
jgi:chemotaxis protein MotB